jgi:hypothetical protein
MTGRALRLAWLAAGVALSPAAGQAAPEEPPRNPFPVGERLVYEAMWGFARLGKAEMRVVGIDTVRGSATAHIRFMLEGGGFIYPMRNYMDSWIALSDTSSRRFTKDYNERGRKSQAHYEIFPDSGYYRELGVDSVRPTSPRPLDDAAFFYFVRTTPLEVGQRYEHQNYFRPDRNPVVLDVLRRDTLDVPAGRFPSLVVQPTIQGGGILAQASEPRIWFSDDDRRIMVQLKTKLGGFAVLTLRLVRMEQDSTPASEGAP